MEEIELINAALNNDHEAFNQLILKYQSKVFYRAHQLLQNYDVAEDITQEAFILAFRKLYQFRGGSFLAWILGITTHLCYDEFRAWKRAALVFWEPVTREGETLESSFWMEDFTMLPEEAVESNELLKELENGLAKLPLYYQNAVNLVDIQRFSYKEAAMAMDISIGTLKSRLKRGRYRLRETLIKNEALIIPNSGSGTFPHAY